LAYLSERFYLLDEVFPHWVWGLSIIECFGVALDRKFVFVFRKTNVS